MRVGNDLRVERYYAPTRGQESLVDDSVISAYVRGKPHSWRTDAATVNLRNGQGSATPQPEKTADYSAALDRKAPSQAAMRRPQADAPPDEDAPRQASSLRVAHGRMAGEASMAKGQRVRIQA